MVSLDNRLEEIKALVDAGRYFTINRARQYGKTTTLRALNRYLQTEYYVVLMDFQTFGAGEFENENRFALSFGRSFMRLLKRNSQSMPEQLKNQLEGFNEILRDEQDNFRLQRLLTVAMANKIFEMRLYNYYLSMMEMQNLSKIDLHDIVVGDKTLIEAVV